VEQMISRRIALLFDKILASVLKFEPFAIYKHRSRGG
jgi:hypothetical protein